MSQSVGIHGSFHASGGITVGTITGATEIADLTVDTNDQSLLNRTFTCAGVESGFGITDNADGTVDIASGVVYLRSTQSDVGEIRRYTVAASAGLTIPVSTERFPYVDYNSGSPQIALGTTLATLTDDENQNIELYEIARGTTTELHITQQFHYSSNVGTRVQRFLHAKFGVTRTSGLIVGETGTRNLTVTAGRIWNKLNEITISAVDTSGADTFDAYYNTSTEVADQTQWDNAQYDNSGVLAAVTGGQYGFHDVYMGIDGNLILVYGNVDVATQEEAEEASMVTVPTRVTNHAAYIGRLVFVASGATAAKILSAYDVALSFQTINDHGNLSGLSDDDHTHYFNATRMGDGTLTAFNINSAVNNGFVLNSVQAMRIPAVAGSLIVGDGGTSITGINNTIIGRGAGTAITSGVQHTFVGTGAGTSLTTSNASVAVGYLSLTTAVTDIGNTAVGALSLTTCNGGDSNTAVGWTSLGALTTGNYNTAVGYSSGIGLTTGASSVFVGYGAGGSITTASNITAIGSGSLTTSITDAGNTAVGYNTLRLCNGGEYNTVIGESGLTALTTGDYNIGVGGEALYSTTTGGYNVALGMSAGYNNISGSSSVYLGYKAGYSNTSSSQLFIGNDNDGGTNANTWIYGDSSYNVSVPGGILSVNEINEYSGTDLDIQSTGASGVINLLGNTEGDVLFNLTRTATTDDITMAFGESGAVKYTIEMDANDDHLDIKRDGTQVVATFNDDDTIDMPTVVGNTTTLGGAVPLLIDTDGELGTISSIRESKTNIVDLNLNTQLLTLRPRKFNFRKVEKLDDDGKKYLEDYYTKDSYGLIYDEVQNILPAICMDDKYGKPMTVDYISLIVPLLKLVQSQDARIKILEGKV